MADPALTPAPTVLVVDDDADIVSLLSKTLASQYRVLTATSGVEALGIIGAHPVSAVITDQKMPGMTGVQLARAIHREDGALAVVLLTAYSDPADVIAAINEGEVFRFVTKPWNVADLLVTVRSAVERTQLTRENRRLVAALNRQISAVSLVSAVGREVGVMGHTLDVFAELLRRVPDVVEVDLAVALVEEAPSSALEPPRRVMHIHCVNDIDEPALTAARDRALQLFAQAAGEVPAGSVVVPGELRLGARVDASGMVVRVSGAPVQAARSSALGGRELLVPFSGQDGQMGLLVFWSRRPGAFDAEEARLLDVLGSETAVLLRQQREVVLGERRQFDTLMSSLVDGVIVARLDGDLVSMNAAARGMLGLMPEADAATASASIWQQLGFSPRDALQAFETRGPAPVRFSAEILGRPIHGVVSAVLDSRRRLQQVAFTLRDMSEERSIEKAKDELLATLSHELRTPLTAIQASLDLAIDLVGPRVAEAQLPSDCVRYLETARDSSDRLRTMLDDVLDVAKQRSGELSVRFSSIELDRLVERTVESLQAHAAQVEVELLLTTPVIGLGVDADEQRVMQVVGNLVGNALKFAKARSQVRVAVARTPTNPAYVVVSVHNIGPVIPREEFDKIFVRFEQGTTAQFARQKGTGLGLSISASLVSAHDGMMWVNSSESEGTTFSFALPCERRSDAEHELLRHARDQMRREPMRVLVIDDDAAFAEFLCGFLSSAGVIAERAAFAEAALDVARRSPFDVILTDVRMAAVSGLVLTETLRHDPVTRNIPVLVMSVADLTDEARRVGAHAFLNKPLLLVSLLDELKSAKASAANADASRVLIVDSDVASRRMMAQVLSNLGTRVLETHSLMGAEEVLATGRIDALLIADQVAGVDAFAWHETYRKTHPSSELITLFVGTDGDKKKVKALRSGAEDFLAKPLDALELAARMDAALGRRERELGASPTTRLPGGVAIERHVRAQLSARAGFVLCYFDIDHLKAFNDVYGYAKTDAVVMQLGDLLRETAFRIGGAGEFVGHIAGDDFLCVLSREHAETICAEVIEAFDRIIPLYYDDADRRRGGIVTDDRYGTRREFPIMSLSVAAVEVRAGEEATYATLSARAAPLKKRAKALPGSSLLFDSREGVRELRAAGSGGRAES